MNVGLLNLEICKAMEYNDDGYEFSIGDIESNDEKSKKTKSEETKLIVSDGCVYRFNKAKDEIKIECKKPSFLWSFTKNILAVYLCGISIKLLSNIFPNVDVFFNNNAGFIKTSFNFAKQKFDNFVENNKWIQLTKEKFINSEFYKVVIDAGLLNSNSQPKVSSFDEMSAEERGHC